MFYVLSKIFDELFSPLTWAVLLVLVGLGWKKPPGRRRWFAVAGVAVLLLFSMEGVSNALYRSLESSVYPTLRAHTTYDVAIMLGGLVEDRVEDTSNARAFNDNNERLLAVFDVLRTGVARNAILSSGPASPARTRVIESHILADQLADWGISRERLVVEDRSRNTRENAVQSAAIVRNRGWHTVLLITSAYHMPRALGCFHAVGLYPDTLPVDYRSFDGRYWPTFLPRSEYLEDSTAAIREWFGRMVYRIRGFSKP